MYKAATKIMHTSKAVLARMDHLCKYLGRAAEHGSPRRHSAVLCSRPDGRAKLSKWVVRWASLALAWIHSEHAALPKLLTSQEGAVRPPAAAVCLEHLDTQRIFKPRFHRDPDAWLAWLLSDQPLCSARAWLGPSWSAQASIAN